MKKPLGLLVAGVLMLSSTSLLADALKVALVLPGPITDGTFNSAAFQGIEAAKKKYDLKVSVRENTDLAQIPEVLRSYADEGYDVIIGHGFQFAEPILEVHARYPKTWFIVNAAPASAKPNVASFNNPWGEAGYLAGAVAGLFTKSNVIGHVGGVAVPALKDYNTGFERGAKRVNPGVKVLSAYVGSFTDVARAAEITTSLIEQGADVISSTGNENVIGSLKAAQKAGIHVIGTAFDSRDAAPDTILTTALVNMGVNIDQALSKIRDRSIEPKTYVLGLAENAIGLAPFRNFEDKFSKEKKETISKLMDDIRQGKVHDLP